MSFSSWLRAWKRFLLAQAWTTRRAHCSRAGLRPRLETLEERTMPASYTASTTSDLISAISAANQAGGSNTITLAPGARFTLTAVNNTTNGANGLPVIAKGNDLTIIGSGDIIEGSNQLSIFLGAVRNSAPAGTPAFRLLDVVAGASLTLENLTLQKGLAQGTGSAADGGAIYNQGTLVLDGVTVQNNSACGMNGANVSSSLHPSGQPGADAAGGAIWSSGTLTLRDGTIIQYNQALGGKGGGRAQFMGTGGNGGSAFGAAVYEAGGSVAISDAAVVNNRAIGGEGGSNVAGRGSGNGGAAAGGGVDVAAGTLTMKNDTVKSDQALGGAGGTGSRGYLGTGGTGTGGGVYVVGGSVTIASTQVVNDTARGGSGGGFHFTGGATQVAINSYRGFGGSGLGGGLYAGAGSVTLTADTVTGNSASAGGSGIRFFGAPAAFVASATTSSRLPP